MAPAACRKTLICSLVIALIGAATVISAVQCTSIKSESAPVVQPAAPVDSKPKDVPVEIQAKSGAELPAAAAVGKTGETAGKPATVAASEPSEQETSARRGRFEPPSSVTEKPSAAAAAASDKDKEAASKAAAAASKPADSKSAATSKPATPGAASASGGKQQLTGKSGSGPSKKLPANLGTVTSTGSGGPAHYMSKHDAYSAIAEKHGALAQDAMRKADKRQQHNLHQRFGGIQKASGGLGDMMSPFKGVTDSGLARTLGASMRSIMKGKYSVPAYLASAVLGAVALMAFYESPISPLPVPPLPEPPVGRFPPEMPNISPNLAVPFRVNQQNQGTYGQNYQRSFQVGQQQQQQQPLQSQPQQQQVLFPGATAQQRQMSSTGPVQQLAQNLISSVGANRQTAQRKSGLDYEPSSSRSFFGSSSPSGHQHQQQHQHQLASAAKLSAPANSHQSGHKSGAMGSMLSFLGLGGGGSDSAQAAPSAVPSSDAATNLRRQITAGGGPASLASGSELKGQPSLSNSHLVNKVKSYFERPLVYNIWPLDHHAPSPYDQYRRMSLVQALGKDTAFLSSFLTPARRSSNATGLSATTNQLQQSISNVLAAAAGGSQGQSQAQSQQANVAQQQARMQVDQPLMSAYNLHQQQSQQLPQQPIVNTKRASSGYGLMRAADRIGHALLETFTSGLLHRNSQPSDSVAARKSEEQQQQQQNALASATSLLSDIMSSYNAQQNSANQQQQHQQHQQQVAAEHQQNKQQMASEASPADKSQQQQQQSSELAQGRSADQSPAAAVAQPEQPAKSQPQPQQQQTAAAVQSPESGSQAAASPAASTQPLVRKTRSIGLDYPMEPMAVAQPSRASQINNLVDMVSDSYKQNKLLFSFVMNQVGLSHALPYVDQFLGTPNELRNQHV